MPSGSSIPPCWERYGGDLEENNSLSSWWLKPTHLRKYESKWKSSQNRGEHKKCLKPPPSYVSLWMVSESIRKRTLYHWSVSNNQQINWKNGPPLESALASHPENKHHLPHPDRSTHDGRSNLKVHAMIWCGCCVAPILHLLKWV